MTLSIDVPQELASRLQQAGIEVEDAGRYALEALSEAADHAEVRAWWDSLSAEQQAKETARTAESLAQADAGDYSPADEVFARVRSLVG